MNNKEFKLYCEKISYANSFKPTETSRILIKSVLSEFEKNKSIKNKKILDLGCGSGIISIILNNKFPLNLYFASDFHDGSIEESRKNFEIFNLNIKIKKSNVFDNWNEKFDYIIDDISGVSSIITKHTNWFNNSLPSKDIDGINLLNKMLDQSHKYLNDKGILYFPLLSVSNEKKALKNASKKFNIVLTEKSYWQAPKNLIVKRDYLENLKEKEIINFEEKYGSIFFWTSIYKAKLK